MGFSQKAYKPMKAIIMKFLTTRAFGLFAAIATVMIWAAFMLITRSAVQGDFTVEEILVLRLIPGLIVMMPVMWKLGIMPIGQS